MEILYVADSYTHVWLFTEAISKFHLN